MSVFFHVYEDPSVEGCFVAGDYVERDRLGLVIPNQSASAGGGTIPLELVLTVGADQGFSIRGGIPS